MIRFEDQLQRRRQVRQNLSTRVHLQCLVDRVVEHEDFDLDVWSFEGIEYDENKENSYALFHTSLMKMMVWDFGTVYLVDGVPDEFIVLDYATRHALVVIWQEIDRQTDQTYWHEVARLEERNDRQPRA